MVNTCHCHLPLICFPSLGNSTLILWDPAFLTLCPCEWGGADLLFFALAPGVGTEVDTWPTSQWKPETFCGLFPLELPRWGDVSLELLVAPQGDSENEVNTVSNWVESWRKRIFWWHLLLWIQPRLKLPLFSSVSWASSPPPPIPASFIYFIYVFFERERVGAHTHGCAWVGGRGRGIERES